MPSPEHESEEERLNRNFEDLLQELRVSQNGTQILFAFLLTVPFTSGFKDVTDVQKAVYFAALLLSGMSAAMLIAPAVMHRILFRTGLKKELVYAASRVALGGQIVLTLAVTASVYLISSFLYGPVAGLVIALGMFLYWVLWFFVVPIRILTRHHAWDDKDSST